MEEEVEYEPLELQRGLYDAVEKAWGDYYKEKLGEGALTCDESGLCGECPWMNKEGCQMEHFELVIMAPDEMAADGE